MIKIGLIREGKVPVDNRVIFTPEQCLRIKQEYGAEILVQPSDVRCIKDSEYTEAGLTVQEDLSECDILFGVKEVPVTGLLSDKTYLFFSHTRKKQPYNQKLMHQLIQQRVRLIDYECLVHDDGDRIVGFGFYAGVVGAHNGMLTYGKKTGKYLVKAAHDCHSYEEMLAQYDEVALPPVKIVVTGAGRVAHGIVDVMEKLNIRCVEPEAFLKETFNEPVYTQISGEELYARKSDGGYDREEFHKHPELYNCTFAPYAQTADILMNGIYWVKSIAPLFTLQEMQQPAFALKVIADITCDIDGSVPCNVDASTIADPVYGFSKSSLKKGEPFVNDADMVDVMAVDNLPNELPRDASHYFGDRFLLHVMPHLMHQPPSHVIARATICENGKLTSNFEYLSDYAYGEAVHK